jgi:hypothetical protein
MEMSMEADGSSGNFCGYCSKAGHRTEQCREKTADRRFEMAIGCGIGLLLVPFALIGLILGIIGSSVWGGVRYGLKLWPEWAEHMKKLVYKEKS